MGPLTKIVAGFTTAAALLSPAAASSCETHTQPNPIAHLYPSNATGVLNGTLAIMTIPMRLAMTVIPSTLPINENAIREEMPDFPSDLYPVFIQAVLDHDIQVAAAGLTIPDFSRVGFEFPFIDVARNGHSSYRWIPTQFIDKNNSAAIDGSKAYGTAVFPADFDPQHEAYNPEKKAYNLQSNTHRNSFAALAFNFTDAEHLPASVPYSSLVHSMHLNFWRLDARDQKPLYPLSVFRNITNQPIVGDGRTCDQQIRLFHTALADPKSAFAPRFIQGIVSARHVPPLVPDKLIGKRLNGVQIATPFIENNYLDCKTLAGGYDGPELPGY